MGKKSSRSTQPRKTRKQPSAARAFWDMTTAELEEATGEFDREFAGKTFKEPTPAQKTRLARAKRKRGRPQLGQGIQVISVSLEKGLLKAVDDLAKKKKAKRAELITFGLRAVLNGDVPVATR
jgi:hypothetical protein